MRLSHLRERLYKFNKYMQWMEKEELGDCSFYCKLKIPAFFRWWLSSVWGDEEGWNMVCDYYLSISTYPCGHGHGWERKLLSLLLLVCKQTVWGLLACCMEPTTEVVNSWDNLLSVFYMSRLEKLCGEVLTIQIKSWIWNIICVCLSNTGQ